MPVSDAVRREYERKLEPANMAVQLMRAGSLITGYELAKRIILENVRGFFGPVDDEYDREVLARDRKSEFRANVAWLIQVGALDEAQAATLEELHSHRHQVVHELPAYLVDPDSEVRMDLLAACQSILRSLAVFWGRITIDTDPAFDGREVLDDDIQSGASALFDHLLQVMIVIEQSMVRPGEVPTSPGSRPSPRVANQVRPRIVPTLSYDQVMDLYRAILANAMELTEEAQILLDAGRWSRAYTLAHLAHEEIAKCLGLMGSWAGEQIGGLPQWELFWKKWGAHDFKVQVALAGDVLRRASGELPAALALNGDEELPPHASAQVRGLFQAMEAEIPIYTDLVRRRTSATYVDHTNGKPVLPSDVISEAMARNMTGAAQLNCAFMAQVGTLIDVALPAVADHPAFKQVLMMLAEVGTEEAAEMPPAR